MTATVHCCGAKNPLLSLIWATADDVVKLPVNYSIVNRYPPYLPVLHQRVSQTVLLLSLQTRFTIPPLPGCHLHCPLSSPSPLVTPPQFSSFRSASKLEISKILLNCPYKQADSDPIPPTWLLKKCSSVLVPTITNIVNLSLSSGQFHPILKESTISPLIKKSTLNKDQLSNYRPVSNLFLIFKIIQRVVKSRLTEHLSSNNLLNPHQSVYHKHHSTETALLCIHDHLINAIGSQKIFGLCLLNLSAALTPLIITS